MEASFTVTTEGSGLKTKFVSDSGATKHMSWFESLNPVEAGRKVEVDNRKQLRGLGIGSIKVEAYVRNHWITCRLTDVLYLPELSTNLFSIPAPTKKGIVTTFEGGRCYMRLDGKLVALGAMLSDPIYLVRFKATDAKHNFDVALVAGQDLKITTDG